MDVTIRKAVKEDMLEVLKLIKDLAFFEKEPEAVEISVKELENDGFGANPLFTCFVAEHKSEIIGIALVYLRYSTWKGKALHLEDLVVSQKYRGFGIGTKLLDEVILLGKQLNVRRIGWEVLDWNTNAISFYESKGANILKDWHLVQMNNNNIENYISNI